MTANTPFIARLFSFVGGSTGPWLIDHMHCVVGEPIVAAQRLSVIAGPSAQPPSGTSWLLRGITSNERYVIREEKIALVSKQEGLGRNASTRAALIPIRKNAAWWALPQDERREVFEAHSRHIAIGLKYLPAVARRLHHCRDLGPDEPSTFSPGSSTRLRTRRRSKNLYRLCAHHPNGSTLTVKSTSASPDRGLTTGRRRRLSARLNRDVGHQTGRRHEP